MITAVKIEKTSSGTNTWLFEDTTMDFWNKRVGFKAYITTYKGVWNCHYMVSRREHKAGEDIERNIWIYDTKDESSLINVKYKK